MEVSVLIIDDNVLLNTVQRTLIKNTWPTGKLLACYDGQTALHVLDEEAGSGKKVLVLLDINMPVMDGWDVLDSLQNKPYQDNIYVVMNSSSDSEKDELRAMHYEQVIAFNKKPLTGEVLAEIVRDTPLSYFFADPISK